MKNNILCIKRQCYILWEQILLVHYNGSAVTFCCTKPLFNTESRGIVHCTCNHSYLIGCMVSAVFHCVSASLCSCSTMAHHGLHFGYFWLTISWSPKELSKPHTLFQSRKDQHIATSCSEWHGGNPDWLQKAQVTSMHALRPLLVTLKRPRTILQAALWWLVVGRFYWWCSGFWPHWCNTLVMVAQSYWEVHSYNSGTHF